MKKVLPLVAALIGLGIQTTFAAPNPENKAKAQFQFTTVDLTQNSWDYAFMHFNVNDLNTGESLDIPSFLIQYEVKDKTGTLVASGNGLYMNVMDNKLGSEEDYTIVVSTHINGQVVSKSICKKASPKKFAMKVDAAALESGSLAANDVNYSFTRPKYSNHAVEENVQIAPTDMYVNVAGLIFSRKKCPTHANPYPAMGMNTSNISLPLMIAAISRAMTIPVPMKCRVLLIGKACSVR